MKAIKRSTKMVKPVVENKFWLKHNNGGGVHYDGPFRSVDEAEIHAMFCSYKAHGVTYSVVTYSVVTDAGDRVISRQYPEYREWRKNVYERDEYTCQVCGDDKGGNLVAHHIFSHKHHPSLRLEVDNGYTMCDPCHREFHSWNGGPMKKCTLDDLNEWLSIEKQREIL